MIILLIVILILAFVLFLVGPLFLEMCMEKYYDWVDIIREIKGRRDN